MTACCHSFFLSLVMKTFVVIEPIDLLVNLKLLIMHSEAMKTVAPRQLKNG